MLKQYFERRNVTSHCLLSAEANVTVDEETENEEFGLDECVTSHCLLSAEANVTVDEETENEEFGLDECAFPTAKQPQAYNDVYLTR